jgi:alkanesulfonate monooxygenase SsuD/methylene tetrahydromethanopterin reductase-like flavin-dependent oxidoreductase (luciferase family)
VRPAALFYSVGGSPGSSLASGLAALGVDFSALVFPMYAVADEDRGEDERVLALAIEQSLLLGELGFNPWYTEHHFRGPWHSAPLQFAAYIAPQLPDDRHLGFGVLSVPFYHPVRLAEQMNLLDQLTHGRALFGLGSGFPGIEPPSAGLTDEYHGSGQATRDSLAVLERLWDYETGDGPYDFETGLYRGRVVRRITPSPYRRRRPTIIRTARSNDAVIDAARRGWPAFIGSLGADLVEQAGIYQRELAGAAHPPAVLEECLRWSTVDWLSVVVADSDEDAARLVGQARAERMELRERFLRRSDAPLHGPTSVNGNGRSSASQFAAGGDMSRVIAGSPDTVADEVQKVAALGINHLLVRFLGEWHGETCWIFEQSMQLFAERVMPLFRGAGHEQLAGRTR